LWKHPEYVRIAAVALIILAVTLVIRHSVLKGVLQRIDTEIDPPTRYLTQQEAKLEGDAQQSYNSFRKAFLSERWLAAERELDLLDTLYRDTRVVAERRENIESIRRRLSERRGNSVPPPYTDSTPSGRK